MEEKEIKEINVRTRDEYIIKMLLFCGFIFLQTIYFTIVCTSLILGVDADKNSATKYGVGFMGAITFSFLYIIFAIIIPRACIRKDNYGNLLHKCALTCSNNIVVVALFTALYLIYPLAAGFSEDIPLKSYVYVAFIYGLVSFIDLLIQIIILLIREKKNNDALFDRVLFVFQELSILAYFSIIIPFSFKKTIYAIIAFLVVLVITILIGVVRFFITKKINKIKEEKDEVIYDLIITGEFKGSIIMTIVGSILLFSIYMLMMFAIY